MPRVAECIKLGRALPSQPGLGDSTAALWAESGVEEYQAKYCRRIPGKILDFHMSGFV